MPRPKAAGAACSTATTFATSLHTSTTRVASASSLDIAAAMDEFIARTGGGIGGTDWIAPLCDYEPPIGFRWPEYVTTPRGPDWWIPNNPKAT